MKICLDACCLNRPFDNYGIDRNRLEGEAVLIILKRVERGDLVWVSSDALDVERSRNPNQAKRQRVEDLLSFASERVQTGPPELSRMRDLTAAGFTPFDALHIACAELAGCDVFLTTDDHLIRNAGTVATMLRVRADNPLKWVEELIKNEQRGTHAE